MNNLNDWFPDGESSWGNSSTTGRKSTKKEEEEYLQKNEAAYSIWKLRNNRKLNILFEIRRIEEERNT